MHSMNWGLSLLKIEDIRPVAQSVESDHWPDEIAKMIQTVKEIDSVAFGEFYVHHES